jgi:hypothetical protein
MIVNDVLQRMWKIQSWPILRHYPSIYREEKKEQDSQSRFEPSWLQSRVRGSVYGGHVVSFNVHNKVSEYRND